MHTHIFTWDYWYLFDKETGLFHVYFLNADKSLVEEKEDVRTGKFMFHSSIGYSTTKDFESFSLISDKIFTSNKHSWNNTSIWSGDTIKTNDGYLMFYTSRDADVDDGMTQNIGIAISDDMRKWITAPAVRIKPDDRYYTTSSIPGDSTVHAWRDPFVFNYHGVPHMLVSAKDKNQPLGKNGCVALLRSVDNSLFNWEALPPLLSSGFYSEIELPTLYFDEKGEYVLTFSIWSDLHEAPFANGEGGLHSMSLGQDLYNPTIKNEKVLVPESSGIYGCRVVPECNQEIIGFDYKRGGIKKSGKTSNLISVNRNFIIS